MPEAVRLALSASLPHFAHCLANIAPASGTQLKIWTCYSGLAAQTWYYTGDNRISLQNQGTRLSLPYYLFDIVLTVLP